MTLQIIERGGRNPFCRHLTTSPLRRVTDYSWPQPAKKYPMRWPTKTILSRQLLPLVPDIEADSDDETILAELVVAPGSRMAARAVHQTGFTHDTGCFIIGVQRRQRMLRHELTKTALKPVMFAGHRAAGKY